MTDLSQGQAALETPHDINLTLPVPSALGLKSTESGDLLAQAEAFEIDCKEMADIAAANMKACRSFHEGIDIMRREFLEPAQLLVDRAKKWFNPPIDAAKKAEGVYKQKLLAWQRAEQERVAEENRKREEEARKARQEAERKAAEVRAKAEEEACQKREAAEREARMREEAQRKEREAAEESRRAKEAGDREAARQAEEKRKAAEKEARDAALREAAATEQSLAAAENGEAKALAAQVEAAAIATAPRATVAKVAGFSTRKNWKCKFAKGFADDHAVIRAIAQQLEAQPHLIGLLNLDWSAAHKMAKALESATSIPGLEAFNDPTGTGR